MAFLDTLSLPLLALLIFLLRIVDVSMGTVRTIAVVHGRIKLSVFFGFVEVMVWLTAVGQVITRLDHSPLLVVAFAAGYAAGNAVGIMVERRIALGACVVRMISVERSREIAEELRAKGRRVTTFDGQGRDGPRTLVYVSCTRKDVPAVVSAGKEFDPHLFYVVEPVSMSSDLVPLPHPTGWRAAFKKK